MKLKNIIPQRHRQQVIQQFGDARLVRLSNGRHELIGGSEANRTAAFEWVTLFAHEIVFTHYRREARSQEPSRKSRFPSRLLPAM